MLTVCVLLWHNARTNYYPVLSLFVLILTFLFRRDEYSCFCQRCCLLVCFCLVIVTVAPRPSGYVAGKIQFRFLHKKNSILCDSQECANPLTSEGGDPIQHPVDSPWCDCEVDRDQPRVLIGYQWMSATKNELQMRVKPGVSALFRCSREIF